MLRGCLILSCALAAALAGMAALQAQSPHPDNVRADAAKDSSANSADVEREVQHKMRELADSSYHAREAAQRRLVLIGEPARSAVIAGLKDADPEVRARCRRIIQALDFEAKAAAKRRLEAQLERFIADAGTNRKYDFPGWERFRDSVGNDRGSRQLFAELFRYDVDLMTAAAGPAAEAQQLVESRCRDLELRLRGRARVRGEPIGWQSAIALTWLASRSDVDLRVHETSMVYSALVQSDVRRAIDDEEQGPAIRNTIGAWIVADSGREDGSYRQKLVLAVNYEIKQGIQLATKLLRDRRGTLLPTTVSQCVQVFAKLGGKDQIPLLESLLDDKTVCSTIRSSNDTIQTQVRDIALATLVRVTGQELRDYGFPRASAGYRTSEIAPSPHALGFSTSQEFAREDAIKKWRAYRQRSGKN